MAQPCMGSSPVITWLVLSSQGRVLTLLWWCGRRHAFEVLPSLLLGTAAPYGISVQSLGHVMSRTWFPHTQACRCRTAAAAWTWTDLEDTGLGDISEIPADKSYVTSHTPGSQSHQTQRQWVSGRGEEDPA